MELYKSFKIDPEADKNGARVILEDVVNEDGSSPTFYLGRVQSSKKYQKEVRKLSKPYDRQISSGTMDEDVQTEITKKAFCKAGILGWENVYGEDRQPMEFNYQNVKALMDDLPELYQRLLVESTTIENFLFYKREDDSKN